MTAKFDFGSLDRPFEADWPVTVKVPQDGGTTVEQTFMARFRMVSEARDEEISKGPEPVRTLMREYFVGFAKEEGQELTPELFDKLFDRLYVRFALQRAYAGFVSGAAVKN